MGPKKLKLFGINPGSTSQQKRSNRGKPMSKLYSVPEGQPPPPPSQTALESSATTPNKKHVEKQEARSGKIQNSRRQKRRTGAEFVMDLLLCGVSKPRKTYNTVKDLDEAYLPATQHLIKAPPINYNEREVSDPKPETIAAVQSETFSPNEQISDNITKTPEVETEKKLSSTVTKRPKSVDDVHPVFVPEQKTNFVVDNIDEVFEAEQSPSFRQVPVLKSEKRGSGIHRRSHLPKLDKLHAIRPHSQSSPIEEYETIVLPVELGDAITDVPITQKALTKRASRILLDESSGEFAKEFQVFDLKEMEIRSEKKLSAPLPQENNVQHRQTAVESPKLPDVPIYSNVQHIIHPETTNYVNIPTKFSSSNSKTMTQDTNVPPNTKMESNSVTKVEIRPLETPNQPKATMPKAASYKITKVVPRTSEAPSKLRVPIASNKIKSPDLEALIESMRQEVIEGSRSPIGSRSGSMDELASEKITIPLPNLIQPVILKKRDEHASPHLGINKGIQWENNSCYMDTTLFCMFYQSHAFDSILIHRRDENEITTKIRKSLTDAIVEPLRKRNYCEAERIYEFHKLLGQINSKLLGSFADPEEFLYTLLEDTLQVEPFIQFTGGMQELMHMITLDSSNDCRESWSSTQRLLEMSMRENSLEFASLPFPALLLQLPRCDGVLQRYEFVIPNLELDLCVMLPNNGLDTDEYLMSLTGVICFRHGHYTCFHKCPRGWVYFDSMIGNGNTMVEDAGIIEDWLRIFQSTMTVPSTLRQRRKLPAMINRLISDCHICIYVPNLTHTPV